MTCKCKRAECHGFVLLHEKEMGGIEDLKQRLKEGYGNVSFDLQRSPSSGEIFTTFYDLHVLREVSPDANESAQGESPEADNGVG